MIRRPPRSTRTDTLFPYTTPFRSDDDGGREVAAERAAGKWLEHGLTPPPAHRRCRRPDAWRAAARPAAAGLRAAAGNGRSRRPGPERSEERRVGKEWVSTGRSRWSPWH